jgi:5-methyltetrahydrofolate--homocysteine methyltransferase
MNKITLTEIDKKEALYYLGYRGNPADKNTAEGLILCEKMILEAISPGYVLKIIEKDDPLFQSNDIADLLKDSEKAALFCATLGAGADKVIEKSRLISPELQLISDALCNAAIEQVCDKVEETLAAKYGKLTMRFSPGYGDWDIEIQKDIIKRLEATKYIGVTCLDSFIMRPSKSVTAVVGLKNLIGESI